MSNPKSDTQTAPKPNPKPNPKRVSIPGKDLLPDLSKGSGVAVREVVFWVGVIPDCPTEGIDLAGINFPKMNERLIPDPMRQGKKKRYPVVGAIVRLRRDKIEQMREKLTRTVIRFTDGSGTGQTVDPHSDLSVLETTRRRGHLITIPTEADTNMRKEAGRPTHEYTANPNDVAAAKFMFAIPCPDQDNPQREEFYPDTLDITGLIWPDDQE